MNNQIQTIMSKAKTIYIALLLIASAVLLHFSQKDSTVKVSDGLIGFSSAFIFVTGIAVFIYSFFIKKAKSNE